MGTQRNATLLQGKESAAPQVGPEGTMEAEVSQRENARRITHVWNRRRQGKEENTVH